MFTLRDLIAEEKARPRAAFAGDGVMDVSARVRRQGWCEMCLWIRTGILLLFMHGRVLVCDRSGSFCWGAVFEHI